MENPTIFGHNRTGLQASPFDTRKLLESVEAYSPDDISEPEGETVETERCRFIAEAEPVGSVPLPGTLDGAVALSISRFLGQHPEVLIDKLGERLAFERTGARLYDALIAKYQTLSDSPSDEGEGGSGENPLALITRFRHEEIEHFGLVAQTLEGLGADPTAQTPCADISAMASIGIMQVLTDPRTSLPQCLNAILTAELTDNAGWELLVDLTEQADYPDLADNFRYALRQEQQHLASIKGLLSRLVLEEAR